MKKIIIGLSVLLTVCAYLLVQSVFTIESLQAKVEQKQLSQKVTEQLNQATIDALVTDLANAVAENTLIRAKLIETINWYNIADRRLTECEVKHINYVTEQARKLWK